jgi:hypothetical protein
MAMTRTISEQDLPDELPELRKRFPRLVENFEALQKAMAPFGVPSTLRVSSPDPAATTTVRFIFLKQDDNPAIAGGASDALGSDEGSTEQANLK